MMDLSTEKLEEERTAGTAQGPAGGSRRGKLHQEAVSHLRDLVIKGVLQPGERLREIKLSEELGISRTPVREALRTLAAEGLVDLLPNRSVVVSSLHADDVNHLYRVLGALEGLAGELACEQITEEEVGELGGILSRMVDMHKQRDRVSYMELNFLIHRRVVEIAGNTVLLAQWRSLIPKAERARSLANHDPQRWSDALLEHSKMFVALAARNGELLGQLSRDHFLNLMRAQNLKG